VRVRLRTTNFGLARRSTANKTHKAYLNLNP
jgi:hypothetical protein